MTRWKAFDLTWGRSIYACSACEEAIEVPTCNGEPLYNFCPMCGANMNMKKADGCKIENSSEIPNNSTISKMEQVEDEPQTDCETCKHTIWNGYEDAWDRQLCDVEGEPCHYEPKQKERSE